MKRWILLFSFFAAIQALGAPVETVRVLKDTTTLVAIELSEKTVFCTDRGYGNVQLKVSVPDLDWLAHFDHRVVGESSPCITGGECSDLLKPSTIIRAGDKFEVVPVRVVLSETLKIDEEKSTCERFLEERVSSYIRGKKFEHFKNSNLETVEFEKCQKVEGL